jgi:hypothetical protein
MPVALPKFLKNMKMKYAALCALLLGSVLGSNGAETARFSGPAKNPAHPANNPLPWTNPANIAFNNKAKTLLVTNHAGLTGLPDPSAFFAIFDVYVKDKAGKLFNDEDED